VVASWIVCAVSYLSAGRGDDGAMQRGGVRSPPERALLLSSRPTLFSGKTATPWKKCCYMQSWIKPMPCMLSLLQFPAGSISPFIIALHVCDDELWPHFTFLVASCSWLWFHLWLIPGCKLQLTVVSSLTAQAGRWHLPYEDMRMLVAAVRRIVRLQWTLLLSFEQVDRSEG
jgi:hypothetical protein